MFNERTNGADKVGEQDVSHQATPVAPCSDEATPKEPSLGDRTTTADRPAGNEPLAAPPADDVKDRLRAQRRCGPDRPLARLAYVEKELEIRSAGLARLSDAPKRRPDKNLLVHQLVRTADTSAASGTLAPKLRSETVGLYSALPCEDATDSIFNRIIVGSANLVMACQARAMRTENAQAIDINLRHAAKLAKIVIEMVEARERRRGPRQVVVGNVNVEAGGQAIVGNVETHTDNKEASRRPDSRRKRS